MKNKITDLRTHLFEQMERLNNPELKPEDLQIEIQRANAMSELGKVIVDSAKTQVMAAKIMGGKKGGIKTITEDAEDFVEANVIPIERPKAEYSNNGHLKSLEKHGS
jgi:hypothetical protein